MAGVQLVEDEKLVVRGGHGDARSYKAAWGSGKYSLRGRAPFFVGKNT